jgi:hypothetical protein
MSRTNLQRLVSSAHRAKAAIDRADDLESLDDAFTALKHFARTAVRTPFPIQERAQAAEPEIPVLKGLLEELGRATCRVALTHETARRLAATS